MNQLVRSAACTALAAFALAGCGGSGGSAPVQAVSRAAADGPARHASSACTPDSYGYCLALTGQNQEPGVCGPHGFQYTVESDSYQLYYNNSPRGFYTYSNTGRSGCPPAFAWSPRDPAAATGDPNLP